MPYLCAYNGNRVALVGDFHRPTCKVENAKLVEPPSSTRLPFTSVFFMPGGFVVLGDIQFKLESGIVWGSLGVAQVSL